MKQFTQFTLIFVLFAIGIPCRAEEMSSQEIVAKCFTLYRQTPSEREETQVTVIYEGGRTEQKAFTRWILFDPTGEDKVVIKFRKTDKNNLDEGLGLLISRHIGRKDDQWLKMPSLDKIRKIAIADSGKYFGGTDITFEDARQLVGERTQDFDYKILQSGAEGWEIEALPKTGTESGYGKRIFSIQPDFACTAVEYYDTRGELLKKQENRGIETQANGMWRAKVVVVTSSLLKRTTELTVTAREFRNVDASTFTQDFLLRKG
ncbi:hypothetical protein COU00_04040 [Candidatus Falkowbacteria bacterium CG10_big_fil_rev_8_21_14_0_10_43_11]|uniref:Uncharacterized protein TP-0789 domain-containing protein n=1 Tax=Candidatus Falkowbacteria bacterium CG10_big_fil_rev_8_21_14_0_10_43_11 TaxID=1974568 RepID=A0A2M6WL19_9BACT|nr:MAG: hypothetical protein COU00_04040 [Candidatus Falkowbacteria bacterium CG10_big_fil_rev_8_21_14_0_10_43_11]